MSENERLDAIIGTLIKASDGETVKAVYREWADSYNDDLDGFGYVAPQTGCNLLQQFCPDLDGLVLDAGCGTGKVGVLLREAGYTRIHGSDFSQEMLQVAQNTNCYSRLEHADYTQPLPEKDDVYDAVISIGVYSGRFGEQFVNEMTRVVKPGGIVIFSCREQFFDDVWASVGRLHRSNSLAMCSVQLEDYMAGQNARAYYVALQKCKE